MKKLGQSLSMLFVLIFLVPSHINAQSMLKDRMIKRLESEHALLERSVHAIQKIASRQKLSDQDKQDLQSAGKRAAVIFLTIVGIIALALGGRALYETWVKPTTAKDEELPLPAKEIGSFLAQPEGVLPPIHTPEQLEEGRKLLESAPQLPAPKIDLPQPKVSSGTVPPPPPAPSLPAVSRSESLGEQLKGGRSSLKTPTPSSKPQSETEDPSSLRKMMEKRRISLEGEEKPKKQAVIPSLQIEESPSLPTPTKAPVVSQVTSGIVPPPPPVPRISRESTSKSAQELIKEGVSLRKTPPPQSQEKVQQSLIGQEMEKRSESLRKRAEEFQKQQEATEGAAAEEWEEAEAS